MSTAENIIKLKRPKKPKLSKIKIHIELRTKGFRPTFVTTELMRSQLIAEDLFYKLLHDMNEMKKKHGIIHE